MRFANMKQDHYKNSDYPGIYQEACRILKVFYGIDANKMDLTSLQDMRRLIDMIIFQKKYGNQRMIMNGTV